jgi:hypothetical protein
MDIGGEQWMVGGGHALTRDVEATTFKLRNTQFRLRKIGGQ